MQTAGKICPACSQKIIVATGAGGCPMCECAWHAECVDNPDVCPSCGFDAGGQAADGSEVQAAGVTGSPSAASPTSESAGAPMDPLQSMMAGGALILSGQWLIALLACGVWSVIRKLKPETTPEVGLVVSILTGTTLLAPIAARMAADGEVNLPDGIWIEAAAVQAAALWFWFKPTTFLAILLAFHSLYGIAGIVPMLSGDIQPPLSQRTVLGAIALKAILIWQLVAHIIKLKRRPVPAERQTTLP